MVSSSSITISFTVSSIIFSEWLSISDSLTTEFSLDCSSNVLLVFCSIITSSFTIDIFSVSVFTLLFSSIISSGISSGKSFLAFLI